MIKEKLSEFKISEKFTQSYVEHPSLQLRTFHLGSTMANALPFLESTELARRLLSKVLQEMLFQQKVSFQSQDTMLQKNLEKHARGLDTVPNTTPCLTCFQSKSIFGSTPN